MVSLSELITSFLTTSRHKECTLKDRKKSGGEGIRTGNCTAVVLKDIRGARGSSDSRIVEGRKGEIEEVSGVPRELGVLRIKTPVTICRPNLAATPEESARGVDAGHVIRRTSGFALTDLRMCPVSRDSRRVRGRAASFRTFHIVQLCPNLFSPALKDFFPPLFKSLPS